MADRKKYGWLCPGTPVFFYYDDKVPCVEGTIEKIMNRSVRNGEISCRIQWNEGGVSRILYERIFPTKEACMAYAKSQMEVNNHVCL